jgi:hypothetical protein
VQQAVVRALTGVEEAAEDALDDRQVCHLARTHSGQRLVEMRYAVREARENEHDAEGCQRLTLQITVAPCPGLVDGFQVEPLLLPKVAPALRLRDKGPAVLVAGLFRLLQQGARAPDPAGVHGPVAVDRASEPPNGPCGAGSAEDVALLAVSRIRALIGIDRPPVVERQMRRLGEALEDLARRGFVGGAPKRSIGELSVAALVCVVALTDQSVHWASGHGLIVARLRLAC